MPWTAGDAQSHTGKANTPAKQSKWASIANSVLSDCLSKGGNKKVCEAKAVRIANSKMSEDNEMNTQLTWKEYQTMFATKPQDKPGGSNVGKYKKGPFCGPSGGAPAGSYPVDTRKRARAALAYARHAPNPEGIKACVYRHYPDMKPKKGSKQSETIKLSLANMRFVDPSGNASVQFSEVDGKEKATLKMIAYSGGVIKHPFWGKLYLDLKGMQFPKERYPVLEEHERTRKIAVTGKPIIKSNQLHIDPDTTEFLDTEASLEFQKLSKTKDFPFEASIYAKPGIIEEVGEGTTTKVNGFSVDGPAVIWRESIFKEASVCVFGMDPNTSSLAFSEEVEVNIERVKFNSEKEVEKEMTLDELKTKYPDLYEQVKEEGEKEATEQFEEEKKTLTDKIALLEKANKDKETENSKMSERVNALEKVEALRAEKDIQREVDGIWLTELKASEVPERIHPKVQKMVGKESFVKDGKLDREAFTAKIREEIKDWENSGMSKSVIGTTTSDRGVDEEAKLAEKQKKTDGEKADELLAFAGQAKKTT